MQQALHAIWEMPFTFLMSGLLIFNLDRPAPVLVWIFLAGPAWSLILGVLLLFKYRSRRLWAFLIPFGISEALLLATVISEGVVIGQLLLVPIAYFIGQVALVVRLVIRAEGARWPAAAFAIANLAYALWVGLLAFELVDIGS
jgi:hypothetical protein